MDPSKIVAALIAMVLTIVAAAVIAACASDLPFHFRGTVTVTDPATPASAAAVTSATAAAALTTSTQR